MKIELKQNKAITLIALIITIIVLLILAGVSIATLTGDNGILKNANKARNELDKATAKERIELEVLSSINSHGNIDEDTLIQRLKNNLNINTAKPFPIKVTLGGYNFEIHEDGNVVDATEEDNSVPDLPLVDDVDSSEIKILDLSEIETFKFLEPDEEDEVLNAIYEKMTDDPQYITKIIPENIFETSDYENYGLAEICDFELTNNDFEEDARTCCIKFPTVFEEGSDIQLVIACDLDGDDDISNWEFLPIYNEEILENNLVRFEFVKDYADIIKEANRSIMFVLIK